MRAETCTVAMLKQPRLAEACLCGRRSRESSVGVSNPGLNISLSQADIPDLDMDDFVGFLTSDRELNPEESNHFKSLFSGRLAGIDDLLPSMMLGGSRQGSALQSGRAARLAPCVASSTWCAALGRCSEEAASQCLLLGNGEGADAQQGNWLSPCTSQTTEHASAALPAPPASQPSNEPPKSLTHTAHLDTLLLMWTHWD